MTDSNNFDAVSLPTDVLPTGGEAVVFDAPWQARAFGLAVAMYDHGDGDWSEFQGRLVDRLDRVDPVEMDADIENVYYSEWLESLEAAIVDEGICSREEIDWRQKEFTEGERDASEFVDGDTDH